MTVNGQTNLEPLHAMLAAKHAQDRERRATGRPTSTDYISHIDPTTARWVETHDWDEPAEAETTDSDDPAPALPYGTFDLDAYRSKPLQPRSWLETGIFEFDAVNKLTAASGVGKSILLVYCIIAWLLGFSALDKDEDGTPRKLHRPLRILYFDGELGPRWWHRILTKIAAPEKLPNLLLYTLDDNPLRPTWGALSTPEGARQFLSFIEQCGELDVIIIDTLSAFVGGEENSNDTWAEFDRLVTLPLKAAGFTLIYVDHSGHNGERARGGSAKRAKLDVEWFLDAPEKSDLNLLRLSNDPVRGKMRNGFEGFPNEVYLRRSDNPLTHTRITKAAARMVGTSDDPKVLALVTQLDKLKIAPAATKAAVRERLREADVKASNDDLLAAIAYRRNRDSAQGAARGHRLIMTTSSHNPSTEEGQD